MKRLLMIAFHYPPFQASSAIQRTLKFCEYLPQHGWEPIVLTAHPRAYTRTRPGDGDVGPVSVHRAFALDAARHLSLFRRYPHWLALPDRWVSWAVGGVPEGLALIRDRRPDLLWSTFPIATAHLIGLALHTLSDIPWVADFRDPMTEPDYPREKITRGVRGWIERRTLRRCSRAVFTAPGAMAAYAERYPELPGSRWSLVPNGYDESDFVQAERLGSERGSRRVVRLVHSGLLYRSERDPSAFYAAVGELRRSGTFTPANLQIVLRASGNEDYHRQLLRDNEIEDLVLLESRLPYHESLAEMLAADGLLVFQAANCNRQIPAKLYECLRAGRPILALTDPRGDTAGELRRAGTGTIVRLDDRESIVRGLQRFVEGIRRRSLTVADPASVERCSRRGRAEQLARLLDEVLAEQG